MSTKSIPAASINRETAVALIDAALAAARDVGIEAAIAVTDATGHLRAFERTDGAPFLTASVAVDKAWTSASFGFPTHVWNDYVTNDPKVAPLAHLPRMVAVGGGYPITEDQAYRRHRHLRRQLSAGSGGCRHSASQAGLRSRGRLTIASATSRWGAVDGAGPVPVAELRKVRFSAETSNVPKAGLEPRTACGPIAELWNGTSFTSGTDVPAHDPCQPFPFLLEKAQGYRRSAILSPELPYLRLSAVTPPVNQGSLR